MFFLFFLAFQCCLFFIDICISGFFCFPSFNFTIAGLLLGCYATYNYLECSFLLTPALLHGSATTGIVGNYLAFFIALIAFIKWVFIHVQHQVALVYGLMLMYIGFMIIKAYFYTPALALTAYTILSFAGTMSLIYFSLKWLIAVKRGNRL